MQAEKIFFGDSLVDRMYQGDTLVYQDASLDVNYITFADASVAGICAANFDTNNDSSMTYTEAAAVRDIGQTFADNTYITSFNELQYFTGLRSIYRYAFSGCSNLTSVIIPNGVTTIDQYAFNECTKLSSVNISGSVTSIGICAFKGCSSLTSVIIPNGVTIIDQHAFNGCTKLSSVNISNSVTSIGRGAFNGCSSLTSINIPNSVTSFGKGVFMDCTRLTSITIPTGVTYINSGFCAQCSSLTSVSIPTGVTTINDGVFYNCTNLRTVVLPSTLRKIGLVFALCTNLTSVTINSTTVPSFFTSDTSDNYDGVSKENIPFVLAAVCFYGCKKLAHIYVPSSAVNSYKAAPGWSDYASIISAIQ